VGWGDTGFEPGTAGQQSGTLPLSHHASLVKNESVPKLRIRRKNLNVTENMRNEVNLQIRFLCLHTENMQNESVHTLRIRRMNLFVY
jgi:hypothetical protein